MLRLHNDIVNSMDVETGFVGSATEHHGRDCFGVFYNNLRYRYESIKADSPDLLEEEAIKFIYELFWEQYQNELGHYFRYLYTMFKFIKTSDVEDKRLYSNIVRAQLSDQDLLIIFYNCLYLYGRKKFKPLVEEFAIFDNLPDSLLLNIKHKEFYLPNAFGDR
jgi:hypothetical protein